MIETRKVKMHHLLDKCSCRSYEDIIWMTVSSFSLGVGSKGPYNKNRKKQKTVEGEGTCVSAGNGNVSNGKMKEV